MNSARQPNTAVDTEDKQKNAVHALIARIEEEFRRNCIDEHKFCDTAFIGALGFIKMVSQRKDILFLEKVRVLSSIYSEISKEIDSLVVISNVEPTARWEERNDTKYNPCDFVKNHYHNYGKGLSLSDIRRKDPKLCKALENYKSRYGWPTDFTLPTKSEKIDEQLRNLDSDVSLAGAMNAPPAERKARQRVWQAQYRRRKSTPQG